MAKREGWKGWDTYAPFYDWENARTLGRKDVPFWTQVGKSIKGRVLELGCGTGRIALPLARAGVRLVGVDRSAPMLERAANRARRLKSTVNGRSKRRKLPLVRPQPKAASLRRSRQRQTSRPRPHRLRRRAKARPFAPWPNEFALPASVPRTACAAR